MDRMLELDIDALGDGRDHDRIRDVVERLAPVWRGLDEDSVAGLVLNLGWLMDPVMLWGGAGGQTLPIQSRRLEAWSRSTYADLREVTELVREKAREQGVPRLRIGMLVLGIGEFVNEIVRAPSESTEESAEGALYQERGEWYRRQPQLFPFDPAVTLHGPGVDWRQPLRADSGSLATRPDGIAEGDSFSALFADQWSSFAAFVGFDLLLLRDETTTPVHAGRINFDGTGEITTADAVTEWTSALVAATCAIKRASPNTWLCLYSSGLSPTVETRFGRLDITRVVAEGMIDGWVDQTWGGAWQDWWDAGWQGWTFQLSNVLARAALIAEGNRARTDGGCRHYPLVQLLDGWEPYDTLHDYPDKLVWGIWAFTHAVVTSDRGMHRVGGHYLAVGNDRTGALILSDDLAVVLDEVTQATTSVQGLDRALGPVLVASGAGMVLSDSGASEPTEDAVGFLLKWGLPVLSSTTKLISGELAEGCIVGPGGADPATLLPGSLIVASIDDLSTSVAVELGVNRASDVNPMGYSRGIAARQDGGVRATAWPYMPARSTSSARPGTTVIYDSSDGPTATVNAHDVHWWFPPTIANGKDRRMTHYQIGSADPHYAVSRSILESRASHDWLTCVPPEIHATVSVHGWVSQGKLRILLGNVESGWLGDSRHPREVTLVIPTEFTKDMQSPALQSRAGGTLGVIDSRVVVTVGPESAVVLTLIDLAAS
jgi:hypothetical protein